MSKIIFNEYDYSQSAAGLAAQLEEKTEQYLRKKRNATPEDAMLELALGFADFAKSAFDMELDFDEKFIKDYCYVLKQLRGKFVREKPDEKTFGGLVNRAAAFFGVMVIKNLGGSWCTTDSGIALLHGDSTAFVTEYAARYLSGGARDDMRSLYKILKKS